jgi:hypothetical protein
MKLGRPLGMVLYPWFAFCILFWFGMNNMSENRTLVFVLDVVGLSIYESLFLRRRKSESSPAGANPSLG